MFGKDKSSRLDLNTDKHQEFNVQDKPPEFVNF